MRTPRLTALLLAAITLFVIAAPTSAQMILVDNEYYVTELRPNKSEFGVALDKGEYTKNWVHVRRDTKISMRRRLGEGKGFVDEVIPPDRLWSVLRLGTKVRVSGGRNWDGSVSAKQIWF